MFHAFVIRAAAFVMASLTGFASVFTGTIDFKQPPEQLNTPIRQQVVDAWNYGRSNGIATGITVIDRANRNRIIWSDRDAHVPMYMAGVAKSMIAFYAVRKDKNAIRTLSEPLTSMMVGDSNEAADRLWKRFGGQRIVEDTAYRYNLQEIEVSDTWGNIKLSAYDTARMYRSFLDDKNISLGAKKYVTRLMKRSQLNTGGMDASYGIPTALNMSPDGAWRQGWWNKSSGAIVRNSTAIVFVGDVPRVIVVVFTKHPKYMSESEASRKTTEMCSILITSNHVMSQDDAPQELVSSWFRAPAQVAWTER